MKTVEELIAKKANKTIEEVNDSEPFYLHQGEVAELMNEYALQFIHPTKCWACDGVGKIEQLGNMTCQNCKGAGKVILLPTITTTGT